MNQGQSNAILLHVRPHGESGAVATFFTEEVGLLKTYARISKKNRADWQAGNIGQLSWKRRLESQLGHGTWDVSDHIASRVFGNPTGLQTLAYMAEILPQILAEEQPCEAFYARTVAFLATLEMENVTERLALWELQLLTTVGYGLSLRQEDAVACLQKSELAFISPNSGRAVPRVVGEPYAERLLPLPQLFGGPADQNAPYQPFQVTGFFLNRALHGKPLHTRQPLVDFLTT